eukprot:TRINITY_DN1716_c0_g1_i1.p1 TRINITY_DN1716_c0_g1~~TRINITY_DN1716_c0_g1_i1.p1  ORF type:complete len:958 (-),score=212.57 TRINITY_DN1716_c0_g1_i1:38-2716(-)
MESADLYCVFGDYFSAAIFGSDSFECPIPPVLIGFETEVYLGINVSGTFSPVTNAVPFEFYDCDILSSCDECNNDAQLTRCGWCGLTCTSISNDICPSVIECYEVTGSSSTDVEYGIDSSINVYGNGLQDLIYTCVYETLNPPLVQEIEGTFISDTQIQCPLTPAITTGDYSFTLLATAEGVGYSEELFNSVINVFDCTASTENDCDQCLSNPKCNFCFDSGLCASSTDTTCNFVTAECPKFTLLQNVISPYDDVILIPTTAFELTEELFCEWELGSGFTKLEASIIDGNITCPAPNVDDITVNLYFRYKTLDLWPIGEEQKITFRDCPLLDTCWGDDGCSSKSHCGLCTEINSCTLQRNCDYDLWIESTCPSFDEVDNGNGLNRAGGDTISLLGSNFVDTDRIYVVLDFYDLNTDSYISNQSLECGISTENISCTTPSIDDNVGTNGRLRIFYDDDLFAKDERNVIYESLVVDNIVPDNTAIIASGVSGAIFFIILLIILIIIIIKRKNNQNMGLEVAVMDEPDYHALAFADSLTHQFILPNDEFEVWENLIMGSGGFGATISRPVLDGLLSTLGSGDLDRAAKALIHLSLAHSLGLEILLDVIDQEIEYCVHANTIFRGNSLASKMFKTYSRVIGGSYLFKTLAKMIAQLSAMVDRDKNDEDGIDLMAMDIELDGDKMVDTNFDEMEFESNMITLQMICQKILAAISKNKSIMPPEFFTIFQRVFRNIDEKFGDEDDTAVYYAVGGLFFLRFVIPSIFAPHVYGTREDPPSPELQRQLVLIAKVIQTIANLTLPGKKEAYMVCMHDFIEKSIPKIIVFYDEVMNNPSPERTDIVDVPHEAKCNAAGVLYNMAYMKKDKILEYLQEHGSKRDRKQFQRIIDEYGKVEKAPR